MQSHLKIMRVKTAYKGRQNRKTEGTLDCGLLSLDLVYKEEKLLDKTDNVKMAIGLDILIALRIPLNLGHMEIRLKNGQRRHSSN